MNKWNSLLLLVSCLLLCMHSVWRLIPEYVSFISTVRPVEQVLVNMLILER
eukprot:c7447_g1_i1 orf=13-165(+)